MKRKENNSYYLWFPQQFLVTLAEELPDVGMVSAIGPSCDWVIILEEIQKQGNTYSSLTTENTDEREKTK